MTFRMRNPIMGLQQKQQIVLPCIEAVKQSANGDIIWEGRTGKKLNNTGFYDLERIWRNWNHKQEAVALYQRYLTILKRATLYGVEGFIQLQNSYFIRDTYWTDTQLYQSPYSSKLGKLFYRHLQGNWFSMLLYYSWGYYHWFCDVLPRLFKIREYLPKDTYFIIHKNPPAWMRKSLELMDIPFERCYEFDGRIPLKLENLYFTPPVAMTGDHDPEALCWVRNTMMQKAGITPAKKPSLRLYVSRSSAKCRRLVNENELMAKLEPYSFQLVQAENLTLKQQIELFAQAEWIIGPHGAGLTNMLYAPSGTKVIEIFEPSILRRCYYQMSDALNHKHYVLVAAQRKCSGAEPNIYLSHEDIANIIKLLNVTDSPTKYLDS